MKACLRWYLACLSTKLPRLMARVEALNAPAADNNKEPILDVLRQVLTQDKYLSVLEIASGTGQHHVYFARHLPKATWQPSDIEQRNLNSIAAHQTLNPDLDNVKPPVHVDCTEPVAEWAAGKLTPASYDVILCINMVHISPWAATEGLFRGASRYLRAGGNIITYGAYKIHGVITPDTNVRFDKSLKNSDPSWGLRDVDDMKILAEKNGFSYDKMFDVPSNNKMLLFTKL